MAVSPVGPPEQRAFEVERVLDAACPEPRDEPRRAVADGAVHDHGWLPAAGLDRVQRSADGLGTHGPVDVAHLDLFVRTRIEEQDGLSAVKLVRELARRHARNVRKRLAYRPTCRLATLAKPLAEVCIRRWPVSRVEQLRPSSQGRCQKRRRARLREFPPSPCSFGEAHPPMVRRQQVLHRTTGYAVVYPNDLHSREHIGEETANGADADPRLQQGGRFKQHERRREQTSVLLLKRHGPGPGSGMVFVVLDQQRVDRRGVDEHVNHRTRRADTRRGAWTHRSRRPWRGRSRRRR